MDLAKVTTVWQDNLTFNADVDGFIIKMDVKKDKGGNDTGPRPKTLLLAALSGCSGMDVASILAKMRVFDYQLEIKTEAESTDEHPKIYKTIAMKFQFKGENLPKDKLINAVELSITKYCGVHAMLNKASIITSSIFINDQEVWHD